MANCFAATLRSFAAGLVAWAALSTTSSEAAPLDSVPRTAVMSAFAPELTAILARTRVDRRVSVNGVEFALGELGGEPVVAFASGISMVNAAMTAQLALERFAVRRIVFTGIAGGVDPAFRVGDVSVPERWGQYLEAIVARETAAGYTLPGWAGRPFPPYGPVHPQKVELRSADHPGGVKRFWLPVDPDLLARARAVASAAPLESCAAAGRCLGHAPRVVVGGGGVSGQAFVDNAAFRDYVAATFGAAVLDMESAAVAAVAFSNTVPFIALRSVSDLAGGGPGENEMETFMALAADNAARLLEALLARPAP